MTKKDFARKDTRGVSAAREAMAARYATSVDPTSLPLEQVAHDPTNLRDVADYQDQSISELASSIRYVGVLEVLGVVRRETYLARHPEQESAIGDAAWVVAYGNRRLAAASKADLAEIPVRVVDQLSEQDRTRESRLIENIHRVDLDPLVEGYEVKDLVDLHGKKGRVAEILGKSPGWVTQRLALANLVPQLQGELKASSLTIEQARSLGAVPQSRQLDAWNAGPPYRDPAKVAPSAEVAPQPPAHREAAPTAPINDSPDPSVDFYDVKADGEGDGTDPHAPSNLYDVKHAPSQASKAQQHDGLGDDTVQVTMTPEGVAELLRSRFSSDQIAELIRLLNA